jgi:hypothetical protein
MLPKYFISLLAIVRHIYIKCEECQLCLSCVFIYFFVWMYELGSQWTDFCSFWYWKHLLKSMAKNPNFFKIGKKYWGLLSDDLSMFSCCQCNKITTEALLTATCKTRIHKNALLCFYGTLSILITLLTATYVGTYCCCISIAMSSILICNMQVNDTKRKHCCWRIYLPTGRLNGYNQKWTKIFYTILKEISTLDTYIMYPPSLTSALSVSNTFCPLMSRWITLLECK